VAILLSVVDPITHDEAFGDFEAYVIHLHVNKTPLPLIDESANPERTGPQFLELVLNGLQGDPGVLDILDQQNVPP